MLKQLVVLPVAFQQAEMKYIGETVVAQFEVCSQCAFMDKAVSLGQRYAGGIANRYDTERLIELQLVEDKMQCLLRGPAGIAFSFVCAVYEPGELAFQGTVVKLLNNYDTDCLFIMGNEKHVQLL